MKWKKMEVEKRPSGVCAMAGVPFRGFRRKGYLNMTNKRELEGKALPFCEEAEELSYEEFLWESGDDLHEDGPEYQSVTEDPAEPAAAELAAPGSQGIARVPDAMVKAPSDKIGGRAGSISRPHHLHAEGTLRRAFPRCQRLVQRTESGLLERRYG